MDDVAIAGAGPAGALTALVLARAGLRVRIFDRARFPRFKLCGDTLNPGALAVLARHLDVTLLRSRGDAIDGMLLTGPGGVRVRGRYGSATRGLAITRDVFDHWLIARAIESGAVLEENVVVKDTMMRDDRVGGLVVTGRQGAVVHPARLVIAADGRRSTLAIGAGLARQPARPRRWAIGAYFTGVEGMTDAGEMHVRHGHYIGVAPVPGGLTNACLVVPHASGDAPFVSPAETLRRRLHDDSVLAGRFKSATAIGPPTVLGPMAVDAAVPGAPGLLLAGDAAGFIDPMTGDGLRFALRGAELAAATVLDVFGGGVRPDRAHLALAARRHDAFAAKWRFNRALRSLVASPQAVSTAAVTATIFPRLFESIIRYAGDCDV